MRACDVVLCFIQKKSEPWSPPPFKWAAAGMTRVAATLKNSDYASQYSSQINDLTSWAMEIVKATSTSMDVR